MLKMQGALNNAIYKEFKIDRVQLSKYRIALIDEVGELTHELKGNWCWWKKTQKPVDQAKVLEELTDVWHFALSICIDYGKFEGLDIGYLKENAGIHYLTSIIGWLINCDPKEIIKNIITLTYKLGFTIEDVYVAYIQKNKVNFDRLASGY